MICKHCGKELEPATFADRKWRHAEDQMFVCFEKSGRPMRVGDLYLIAEPKE